MPSSFLHPTVLKSIPPIAFRRTNKPKGRGSRTSCFGTRILDQCDFTHRQQQGGLATAFDLAAFWLFMIAPVKKSVNHSRTVASMRRTD